MISKLVIYETKNLNPYINLATEKFLFDSLPTDTLVLYLWQNQNTVVIGKNQNPWSECKCSLIESEGSVIARRLSGGGAVFHDIGNLNYTFICSAKDYDLSKQLQVIESACLSKGITVKISGRNDITVDNKKFSGNAFYSSNGKFLHHGTLLINTDIKRMQSYLTPNNDKLNAKGIKSVSSRVMNLINLNKDLTPLSMAESLKIALSKIYNLSYKNYFTQLNETINELAKTYSSWDYIFGKTIPFTLSNNKYFSWGYAEIKLEISSGIIHNAKLYTDSMDWTISESVEKALVGCKFEDKSIKTALNKTKQEYANDLYNLISNLIS